MCYNIAILTRLSAIAMAQSHNETATLDPFIERIEEASQKCHVVHQADAQWLADFCRNVVKAITTFRGKTAGMIDVDQLQAEGGTAKLKAMLIRAVIYLEDRSDAAVAKAVIRRALGKNPDHNFTTMQDLKNDANEAVVRHIEPVVKCLECEMEKSAQFGTPLQLRTSVIKAIDLLHAIVPLDGVLGLGWSTVKGYEERLKVGKRMQFEELLTQKIDDLREEVNAGRVHQENGVCPRVFFIVPTDKSKLSALQKVADFNLFTKKMQLYFMCSMFLEKLYVGLQTKTGNTNPLDPAAIKALCPEGEFSAPLEINQPRDFVKKWGPAVKLSLKVVNILVHAAAFGFGAGTLIPNLSLSEHEKLFDVLREDLEAMEKETEDAGMAEQDTQSVAPSAALGSMVLDDSSHAAMQGYLEVCHKQHWQAKVKASLKVARVSELIVQSSFPQATWTPQALPVDQRSYVYVCKDTSGHKPCYIGSVIPAMP